MTLNVHRGGGHSQDRKEPRQLGKSLPASQPHEAQTRGGKTAATLDESRETNAFKPILTTTFKKLFFWVHSNCGIPQVGKMSKDIKGSLLAASTLSKAHLVGNAWGRVKGLNPVQHEAPASGQDSESSGYRSSNP